MSEPIKVGDLVQVVKWPCCGYRLGYVFRVDVIRKGLTFKCQNCAHKRPEEVTVAWDGDPRGLAAQFSWLKRIPPLSELDDVRQDEEIAA